jgi:hypothetical protein
VAQEVQREHMEELIVRETTTVPGIVNLAGIGVLVAAKSVRPFADRIAAWLILLTWKRRELSSEDTKKFWETIRSTIQPPMTMAEFAIVAAIFIAYNVACAWIVRGYL